MKMRHPKDGRTADVAEDQVRMYETQGWARVKPAPAAKKATAKKVAAKKSPLSAQ